MCKQLVLALLLAMFTNARADQLTDVYYDAADSGWGRVPRATSTIAAVLNVND